jgi:hypothetical protein
MVSRVPEGGKMKKIRIVLYLDEKTFANLGLSSATVDPNLYERLVIEDD